MRETQENLLKLGKGSLFVKSQLSRLRLEDEIWEADFAPLPQHGRWVGLVVNQADGFVIAYKSFNQPPTVNDLARLLAEAMRHPLVSSAQRPRTLYIREKADWVEILPHLKQVGIQVAFSDSLPNLDDAYHDLFTRAEEAVNRNGKNGRPMNKKEPTMVRKNGSPLKHLKPKSESNVQLYTLDVFIVSGPVSEKFAKKHPVISRTIQIRGDQTLEDLHEAIFDAFGRSDEHMYEFQFGKKPMDSKAPRYVLPGSFNADYGVGKLPAGRVDQTTLDALGLKVGRRFGYWFDFGDDWWHQINVEAIEDKAPKGNFPKVTKRVGKSPPQYSDEEQ